MFWAECLMAQTHPFRHWRTSAQSVAVPSRLQPPAFLWLTGHAQSDLEVTQLLRFHRCVSWREAALHAWQFLCDRESHSGLCPAPPKEHGSDPIQKQALPSHARPCVVTKEKPCKEVEERSRYLSTGRLVTDIRWLRGKRDTRCAVHNTGTKAEGSSEQSWTRGFFEFRRLSVDIH